MVTGCIAGSIQGEQILMGSQLFRAGAVRAPAIFEFSFWLKTRDFSDDLIPQVISFTSSI